MHPVLLRIGLRVLELGRGLEQESSLPGIPPGLLTSNSRVAPEHRTQVGIKALFCYVKNEGQGFLKFLRKASTGQPWDQEPPEAANICYWHCGICKMKRPGPSLIIPLACVLRCRSNVSHLSVTFSSAIPPSLNSRAKQLEMRRTLTTLRVTPRD